MDGALYRLPRARVAGIVALAVVQAATLGASLLVLRSVIDQLGADLVSAGDVMPTIGFLAALLGANALARGAEFTASEKLGYEVARQLRLRMYQHMQGMALEQLEHRSRGGLLLRFTGDLSMLRTWISRGVARGLVSAIVLAGGLGVVAVLNLRIALTIAGVLCLGAGASAWIGPDLVRVTRWMRRKRSLLTSNVDEQISSLAVVQVFGRAGGELARLSRQNDSLTRSLFESSTIRGRLIGVSTATGALAIVGVLVVGAGDIATGRSSVGVVATALVAARHLTGPVRRLGLSYDYWQRAKVSRQKVGEFLRSSTRPLDGDLPSLRVRRGRLELTELTVPGALHPFTATVRAGETVAIMGPTGAGKSTLLKAVAGLIEPAAGQVLIDGRDAAEHSLRSRWRHLGIVSPDLPLMRGTLQRNLRYRKPTASGDELYRIILACQLDELIDRLPGGLDTWLIEGGRNLSAGERQRIALGRALLGNPPLLLLDEPTMNLDPTNREIVRRVISHHAGTVLLVTHDWEEAALADHVWIMRGGRLADVLTGDDLRDLRWVASTASVR